MKKRNAIFLSILLISLFLISLVSAARYSSSSLGWDLREGSENVIDLTVSIFEPFLDVILGGEDYTGLYLFEKFLLFLIFLAIVYLSLDRIGIFDEQKGVKWIIAIVVPILSLRFIDIKWLNTILLQYQVLGIALLGILPFILYLFFLHNESFDSIVRKIGWIFFIVIYFGLWSTSESESYAQVYFWTAIIALIFLFLDGTIQRYFRRMQWNDRQQIEGYDSYIKLKEKIERAEARPQSHARDKALKKYYKTLSEMQKHYNFGN